MQKSAPAMDYNFTVLYTQDDLNGLWTATVIESVGIFAQGRTMEQARENIQRAFRNAVLDRRRKKQEFVLKNALETQIERLSVFIEDTMPPQDQR
jgi:predicted RNase H-like HicB family nuclease